MDQFSFGRVFGIALFLTLIMLFKALVLWQVRKRWPKAEYWLFSPLWPIVKRTLRRFLTGRRPA